MQNGVGAYLAILLEVLIALQLSNSEEGMDHKHHAPVGERVGRLQNPPPRI
jgi:hypothetical protein